MARAKNTIRTVYHNVGLPEDLSAKVQLHLFSELEGRIPQGELSNFFCSLVREYFQRIDAAKAMLSRDQAAEIAALQKAGLTQLGVQSK